MTVSRWYVRGGSPLTRSTPVEHAGAFLRAQLAAAEGAVPGTFTVEPIVEALGVPGVFPFRVAHGGGEMVRLVMLQPDGTFVAPVPRRDLLAEPHHPEVPERVRAAMEKYRDAWSENDGRDPLPRPRWLVDYFYLAELAHQSYIAFVTFDRTHRLRGVVVGPGYGQAERALAGSPVLLRHPPAIGRYAVHAAGDSPLDNPHHVARGQRYALDLIPLDAASTRVVSPVDGVVAEAVDGLPDDATSSDPVRDAHPYGNLVKISDGALSYWFVHLACASVRVRAGDRVRAGSAIGVVGNSGRTAEPHLHFAVSTGCAVDHGVPLRFLIDGEVVELRRGDAIDTSAYDFGFAAAGGSGATT